MALGMAAKSLIIILYQILSDHVQAFKKWSSLKAYVILNALEIVFWGAVVFMMIQANIKFCEELSCILSWIVVVLGIVMSTLASYMTIVTWLDFRHFRTYGTHRGHHYHGKHLEVQSSESIAMDTAPMNRRHPGDEGQERLDIPKPVQTDYAYYSPNERREMMNHYHHGDGHHHGDGRY
ncbi:hypothetical protein CDV36_014688 [Fusarium kuroshium]|uniref:MARVEL domain-containing protein n=1 Tax=Fusarium kuroshium TaxID=2010991 RepID=A0A3M2RH42_9HYPO|nr:hypothetical protein CDV36_014688 [Fusarium kuroshium]